MWSGFWALACLVNIQSLSISTAVNIERSQHQEVSTSRWVNIKSCQHRDFSRTRGVNIKRPCGTSCSTPCGTNAGAALWPWHVLSMARGHAVQRCITPYGTHAVHPAVPHKVPMLYPVCTHASAVCCPVQCHVYGQKPRLSHGVSHAVPGGANASAALLPQARGKCRTCALPLLYTCCAHVITHASHTLWSVACLVHGHGSGCRPQCNTS